MHSYKEFKLKSCVLQGILSSNDEIIWEIIDANHCQLPIGALCLYYFPAVNEVILEGRCNQILIFFKIIYFTETTANAEACRKFEQNLSTQC